MITRKKKICKECGQETFIFSKGRCKNCSMKDYGRIKKKPAKKDENLEQFFDKHLQLLQQKPYCIETNKLLTLGKIHIAHLLPKRNHKSVATSDNNVVYVSWEVHQDFDRLLDQHRFQDIKNKYPIIWKSLLNVLPLCTEQTKLVKALKQYNEIH